LSESLLRFWWEAELIICNRSGVLLTHYLQIITRVLGVDLPNKTGLNYQALLDCHVLFVLVGIKVITENCDLLILVLLLRKEYPDLTEFNPGEWHSRFWTEYPGVDSLKI
jgi:hypothetical protein